MPKRVLCVSPRNLSQSVCIEVDPFLGHPCPEQCFIAYAMGRLKCILSQHEEIYILRWSNGEPTSFSKCPFHRLQDNDAVVLSNAEPDLELDLVFTVARLVEICQARVFVLDDRVWESKDLIYDSMKFEKLDD